MLGPRQDGSGSQIHGGYYETAAGRRARIWGWKKKIESWGQHIPASIDPAILAEYRVGLFKPEAASAFQGGDEGWVARWGKGNKGKSARQVADGPFCRRIIG